jgi:hypothetical protein
MFRHQFENILVSYNMLIKVVKRQKRKTVVWNIANSELLKSELIKFLCIFILHLQYCAMPLDT